MAKKTESKPSATAFERVQLARHPDRPHTLEIAMGLNSRVKRETVNDRKCAAIFQGPVLLAIDSHSQAHVDTCAISLHNNTVQLDEIARAAREYFG